MNGHPDLRQTSPFCIFSKRPAFVLALGNQLFSASRRLVLFPFIHIAFICASSFNLRFPAVRLKHSS